MTSFEPLPQFLFNGEMVLFALLGVLGGAAGGAFVLATGRFVGWRQRKAQELAWLSRAEADVHAGVALRSLARWARDGRPGGEGAREGEGLARADAAARRDSPARAWLGGGGECADGGHPAGEGDVTTAGVTAGRGAGGGGGADGGADGGAVGGGGHGGAAAREEEAAGEEEAEGEDWHGAPSPPAGRCARLAAALGARARRAGRLLVSLAVTRYGLVVTTALVSAATTFP